MSSTQRFRNSVPVAALERAAGQILVRFAEAACRVRERSVLTIPVAGGVACYAGPDSPLTTTKGLGPRITDADLGVIEEFFRGHGARQCVLELAPWAEELSAAFLASNGYEAFDEEDVLLLSLAGQEAGPADPSVEELDSNAEWTEFLLDAFSMPAEEPYRLLGDGIYGLDGARNLGIRCEGRLAAAAQIVAFDSVATLACDGTQEEFRGRGFQSRLIRERTRLAASEGLQWATAEVKPASGSQRNYLRCGYHVAYKRTHWSKALR